MNPNPEVLNELAQLSPEAVNELRHQLFNELQIAKGNAQLLLDRYPQGGVTHSFTTLAVQKARLIQESIRRVEANFKQLFPSQGI